MRSAIGFYRCPEIVRSFFRSIRKAVCPANTITPTILWGYLRIYLDDGKNEALVINNLLIITKSWPVCRILKKVQFGNSKDARCSKEYQGNSRLGSGIVLFWCAKHKICLGWGFLQSAESLEVVYQTILTRFPIIYKVICYDNACNLAEYCYNRAPRLFQFRVTYILGFSQKLFS